MTEADPCPHDPLFCLCDEHEAARWADDAEPGDPDGEEGTAA